jgi:hypothetical protein
MQTGVAAMSKSGLTVSRALFGVLAAGMLWAAMSAAPAAAWKSHGCTRSNPCSLAFTADGEPASTAVNATITSAFNSQPGPIEVEILNASGQLVTNAKAAVTVVITPNSGSGALSGTTTVNASEGVASFSNLSINQPGFGYSLTATSSGMNPATSTDFTIWGSLQHCSANPCSASQSSATTSGTATTSSAGSDQLLGTALGGASYSCGGTYRPVSDPFGFNVLSASGVTQPGAQFSVTLRIDKSLVKSAGHRGASSWQICYASTMPFTAQPGTSGTAVIGGAAFGTGLLPDCSDTQGSPCVQARHKCRAGDVIITFLASGDPLGKG